MTSGKAALLLRDESDCHLNHLEDADASLAGVEADPTPKRNRRSDAEAAWTIKSPPIPDASEHSVISVPYRSNDGGAALKLNPSPRTQLTTDLLLRSSKSAHVPAASSTCPPRAIDSKLNDGRMAHFLIFFSAGELLLLLELLQEMESSLPLPNMRRI